MLAVTLAWPVAIGGLTYWLAYERTDGFSRSQYFAGQYVISVAEIVEIALVKAAIICSAVWAMTIAFLGTIWFATKK